MTPITIEVVGNPKGQPRPRAVAFAGRARMYDDPKHAVHGWRDLITLAAQPVRPDQPIAGPIDVEMDFRMPRPRSHFTKAGALSKHATCWCETKPDCDNLAKAVLDVLTNIQFWRDDSQVVTTTVSKRYATDRPAGATIKVRAIGAKQ
jgi:Holliday junction resolvase RusA-like endonuclease